jgi:hypothetical protein
MRHENRAVRLITLLSVLGLLCGRFGQCSETWRSATETELRRVIPERAQVENERIETEFRTASGITDGQNRFVAGVVLITAGYAAAGKYSDFLIVQAPIRIESITLQPGEYALGWTHKEEDALRVSLYQAKSGKLLGVANAKRTSRTGRIESFHISPPRERSQIQIGRFALVYVLLGR